MRKNTNQLALYASIVLCITLVSTSCKESTPVNDEVLNIGSRLELFVDDYLIDRLDGSAALRLHHPDPKEISIVHDKPWEGAGSGYHSIFKDGDIYKMYYKSWPRTVSEEGVDDYGQGIFCAYAESDDGILWRKPKVGIYDFKGSKDNNIVFIRGLMGGVNADGGHPSVFKDKNPNVAPDALYKALLPSAKPKGLIAFKSPDGIKWTPMSQEPVITDGAFDSQNLAFWDSESGEYRAYWRYFTQEDENKIKTLYPDMPDHMQRDLIRIRAIRTARSKDMINWYDQKDLTYVDSPSDVHLYTNQINPYYRAPHIFIGFPNRYINRGWSESMRALPELKHRELRSAASERFGTAITDGVFMASHDGVLFKRWNETFLRPGIEREGTWNYGHQAIGCSVVETKSSLEGAPNELSLYAVESYWTGNECSMRRYTLRIDGFVSVNAPMKGGEIVTKPLIFSGKNLILNFSSSAAGDIQVEIQDEKGKPLPGYTLEDCPPVFGDTIERVVTWKNGNDLSSLEGKPIRLRFVLKDADLYSLRFR